MKGRCPCSRECGDCPYGYLCGGCLEDACIHVRNERTGTDRSSVKCLFCEMKGMSKDCPTLNTSPPKNFALIPPAYLEKTLPKWESYRDDLTEQPDEPDWPLLIPEVSDITQTTSRIAVRPDEGDWQNRKWDPIAWDMTGYLFDKVQGAQWVRKRGANQEGDWHDVLGPEENWIHNLIMVDRLPDQLAMQIPPSAIMAAYLNRLYARQPGLLVDEDAPRLWLMTHGYPSYIDWPPAWHWNLGTRMLASLAYYIGSQSWDVMGAPAGTWYPDRSRKTTQDLRVPFVAIDDGDRLLFAPGRTSYAATEMDWIRFPGVIPFVPGADTNQLSWFTKQLVAIGYTTVALDTFNTIAHETFIVLREAVSAVLGAGAKHVMIYGPWPLHIPSSRRPTTHVSYVPSANHMDLTDHPRRFWRKRASDRRDDVNAWDRLPNYRRATLSEAAAREGVEVCECPPCKAAITMEHDPRSIWRWGHLLRAGAKWQRAALRKPQPDEGQTPETTIRLRYQGPSYTVFRRCLHYPPSRMDSSNKDLIQTLVFSETGLSVQFPDGVFARAHQIRWSPLDSDPFWLRDFPSMGG